jgi:rubredoxin
MHGGDADYMEIAGTIAAIVASLITSSDVKPSNKICPICGIKNRRKFYRCRNCGHLFLGDDKGVDRE